MADLKEARQLLKSLSDETRLRILNLLDQEDEINVGELCEILTSTQTMVSKHLMQLRLLGLVTDRRDGTNVYYSRRDPNEEAYTTIVISVTKCMSDFEVFGEDLVRLKVMRGR